MTEHSAIVEAVTPLLSARGLELYDVEVAGAGGARVVRVLVTASSEAAGLDLDAIASATEAISPALDAPEVAPHLPGPYALEVSSPGLERPLRRLEHFRGAVGELVSVKRDGEPRERGTIVTVDDDGIELEHSDGTTARVAYDEISQARTVFEWGATAERGPARGRARR
ncbi:MAG: ribosome maturation factor RimP [Acidimicrobiia bacterium]